MDEENCIFCQIINGDLPCYKVYEDNETLAFLDISPVNPGHCLVIPKSHFVNVFSAPAEDWCRLALTTQKIALAVKHACDADGINIHINNEEAAGQKVFHSHVHIIPRFSNDNLTLWEGKNLPTEEMIDISKKIELALE